MDMVNYTLDDYKERLFAQQNSAQEALLAEFLRQNPDLPIEQVCAVQVRNGYLTWNVRFCRADELDRILADQDRVKSWEQT